MTYRAWIARAVFTAVASVGLLACARLAMHERFEVYVASGGDNRVFHVETRPARVRSSAEVEIFERTAPGGFWFEDGVLRVRLGYRHLVLGRVELWVGDGLCDRLAAPVLGQDGVRARLQRIAYGRGATALVHVEFRADVGTGSDCDRLRRGGLQLQKRPWVSAWAVRLEAPDWAQASVDADAPADAAVDPASVADAGVAIGNAGGEP